MNRTISALCLAALAALVPATLAESKIPTEPLPPELSDASGSFRVGYSSTYTFRGLVPAGNNPVIPMCLEWRTDIDKEYSFIMNLKETFFTEHPGLDLDDETVADLGIQRQLNELTYAAASLRVTRGGMAGLAADRLYGVDPTTAELGLMLRHDLTFLPGFYVQGSAAYSMYGVKGWWFDVSIGTRSRVTEKMYIGFEYGAVLDSSYWPTGGNGWQSSYVRVAAEYRLFKDVYLQPFVGYHWLGKGGHRLNHSFGSRLLKGNAWAAGIMLHYAF